MKKWKKQIRRGAAMLLTSACIATGARPSMAMIHGEGAKIRTSTESDIDLDTDTPNGLDWSVSTPSDAFIPTLSNAPQAPRSNVTGDLWTDWSGDMAFLDGKHGRGTKTEPFQISTKAQLMGLSELTARGMTISTGQGNYVGDYSDAYFKLTRDIDLGGTAWMPIGFYQNEAEIPGEIRHAFSAHFDGGNHTVKNFRMYRPTWRNAGFFGALENAEVKNLKINPGNMITVKENGGILSGAIKNSAVRNVTVSGRIISNGNAGGIAGGISGSVVEDCVSDHISMDATSGSELYIGGIAGKAETSVIVNCAVSTGDGTTARLQGKGYVGGIAGFQNDTDIFNATVAGTIGGAGSLASGGIVGRYASGQMKVGRFSGKVGSSGLGTRAHEGTFIGTRDAANYYTFGPDGDLAYLYSDTEGKITAGICGSGIQEDNQYTYEAHIGYWHTADRYYTLIQGQNKKDSADICFYEELENGIFEIIGHAGEGGNTGEDDREKAYSIAHYAPDDNGRPVRGYLLVVNQIDTAAGGNYFYDVAALTAAGPSQYDRELSKNRKGAIRAGATVTVTTAPQNTESEKFQMEGTPFYTDENRRKKNTTLQTGGTYTFQMPECNTELNAVYRKVAAAVSVKPEEFRFQVIQTRTGNRKYPSRKTEVLDGAGKLIATYINHSLESGTVVQPVKIEAIVDANNDVADSRVRWAVDDAELIHLKKNGDEDSEGYTFKSADMELNLNAGFFSEITARLEREQASHGYQYRIPDTIFGAGHETGGVAVLTASTRPSASFEGKPLTANCKIQVIFQVRDQTQVATEGAVLDKASLDYSVIRRLTGDRIHPKEEFQVTAPQSLTATFWPDYFDKKDIKWSADDSAIVQVTAGGYGESGADGDYKNASVRVLKETKWIQDIIAEDAGIHDNDPYAALSGAGIKKARVTVKADDTLGNIRTADCNVTVKFMTEDRTVVVPEGLTLNHKELTYDLSYTKAGGEGSETVRKNGFGARKLTAKMYPDISGEGAHEPFDRSVKWESSDPSILTVDESGVLRPVEDAEWIQEAMKTSPYRAETMVTVTASANGNPDKKAVCRVKLNFVTKMLEINQETETFDMTAMRSGPPWNKTITWSGIEDKKLSAHVYPEERAVEWTSSAPEILTIGRDGTITPNIDAEWIQEALKNAPYKAQKDLEISASAAAGGETVADTCKIKVKFHVEALELDENKRVYQLVLTKKGPRNHPALTWEGNTPWKPKVSIFSERYGGETAEFLFDNQLLTTDEHGVFTVKTDAPWITEILNKRQNEGKKKTTVTVSTAGGSLQDVCEIEMTLKVIDKTYISSGNSGGTGGGGSGNGSSSSGITTSGVTEKFVVAPEGGVTGTWIQDGAGNWVFTSGGRTYADEWAYIHNPYAKEGQESTSWFRFNKDGHLMVGWYQDSANGNWYYLHGLPDGTFGHMAMGWKKIDEAWYYFNPKADGILGRMETGWRWINGKCYFFKNSGSLFTGGTTEDGYSVNENGEWMIGGEVQTR